MDQPTGAATGSHESDADDVCAPRPRAFAVVVLGLLAFACLGAANIASSLLGSGYLAFTGPLVNVLTLQALAVTPLFVTRLLESAPVAPTKTTAQALLTAAEATIRELCWLLVLLPMMAIGLPVAAGVTEFLLSQHGRYVLAVLVVVAIVEFRRKAAPGPPPENAAARPRPWRTLRRVACWLWLLAFLVLWFGGTWPPLEFVGTDPRDSCRYFARRLQRDTPKERHWLVVARPLGIPLLAWHREVAVEPSLPIDLATLRFEDDGVFAVRRDGTSVRLTLR